MRRSSPHLAASAFICFVAIGPAAARADAPAAATQPDGRLRLGVIGLVHGHIWGFLEEACRRADVELVGMAEPRAEVLRRYGTRHKLPASALFEDMVKMLDTARPEAVAVFTDTFDHRAAVEACAARRIHVMMEKPLAVSLEHALAIERAARNGGIHVLVNYETTWYPATQTTIDIVRRQQRLGRIRKLVAHDGHQGPKEIGMPREFLSWLQDPERNGGGALYDFGCYGANLFTSLMDGRRPQSVTAVTQRLKSDPSYRRVDDEATIVLAYADAQGIVQASWNWPYSRKDIEVYGERGCCITIDREAYRLRVDEGVESLLRADRLAAPMDDPISYLAAVARGRVEPSGPSSLRVNLIVSEILDAARRSAETGKTVRLDPAPPWEARLHE